MQLNKSINNGTINDKRLRELVKSSIADAPRNPWFRNKVLNRLPPRKEPLLSGSEIVMIIAVICTLATLIYREFWKLLAAPDPLLFDYSLMAGSLVTSLMITLLVMIRIFRRV